jgi:hypothetical protein
MREGGRCKEAIFQDEVVHGCIDKDGFLTAHQELKSGYV